MAKIPLPTLQILQMLKQEETLTPKHIQEKLPEYSPKDIKYALRRLREKSIIKRIPNLIDMRRVFYRLSTVDEFNYSLSVLKPGEYNFYLSIISGSEEYLENITQPIAIAKIS